MTLPKVTAVEQVAAFLPVLDALEQAHGLGLDLELQVETPQAVLGADGAATLAAMLHAGGGRVTGLHYGTYDYSASLGIAAAHQASDHPAADHAKATMQVAVAGTGPGRSTARPTCCRSGRASRCTRGGSCTPGWCDGRWSGASTRAGTCTRPSWSPGTPRPTRSSARRCPRPGAVGGLRLAVDGGVLDEPATAKALATVVLRGLDCGALDVAEVEVATGLDRSALDRLAGRLST